MNKLQQRQKRQRFQERRERKLSSESIEEALITCLLISLDSAKQVLKQDATNPKLEKFLEKSLRTWQRIADNEITLQTVANSVETESKIRYDIKNKTFINLKCKDIQK